jgi:hypothetical protein
MSVHDDMVLEQGDLRHVERMEAADGATSLPAIAAVQRVVASELGAEGAVPGLQTWLARVLSTHCGKSVGDIVALDVHGCWPLTLAGYGRPRDKVDRGDGITIRGLRE